MRQVAIIPIHRCIRPGLIFDPRAAPTKLVVLTVPITTRTTPITGELGMAPLRFPYTRTGLLHADVVQGADPNAVTCNAVLSFLPTPAAVRVLAVPKVTPAEPVSYSRNVLTNRTPFLGAALSSGGSRSCSRYDTGGLSAGARKVYRCISS